MNSDNPIQAVAINRPRIKLPLSLILLSILTACSDAGIDDMGPQTVANPDENAASPFTLSPSKSAAELTDDNTLTVQSALAFEAGSNTQEPDAIDPPAAATPVVTNPLAVINTGENENVVDNSAVNEAVSQEITDTTELVDNTDTNQNAPESDTDQLAELPENTLEPADPDTSAENNNNADDNDELLAGNEIDKDLAPDIGAAEETPSSDNGSISDEQPETFFVSKTTPGFEGEVLEDAIRISWPDIETARGYNVYKQAAFYKTVFDTELVDTEVFDDDYYYEIQAFDNDDYLWYVATGLTVSARTLGKTDPDAPQPKTDLLDEYELVFSDEFNNTELDTSKWNTRFLWGTDLIINSEEQYYVDIAEEPDFGFNPFTFDGENLTINTIKTPDELLENANNQPYLSGIITSYDAFKFTYGYAETRAKFTHGRGYWPAFWLLNAYYVDAKPEIDIMEFIGHNQDVIYHTYHYFDSEGKLRSTKSHPVVGIDFTADFHTFGVEWMPGTLIFYVDGIETLRIVDINVSQQEMYVIANQAVGGWWAGPPDETTPFPGKFVIDYIRIYQRTTPYDIIKFDQPDDLIPLFTDSPGEVLPNKRPSIELWPEGYPDGR